MKKYFIIAKYNSKYGQILYASVAGDTDPDFNNVFINTLYFKGSQEIEVGNTYELFTIKGENGYTYCFIP